jgi:EAL domain-containing protein (putative c-di-GMP-specific phosphodiesterase class I)
MTTNAPTSGDLFITKKGRFSRGANRVRTPSRTSAPSRQSKQDRLAAERLREERDRLIRLTITNRAFETHFQPIVDLRSGNPVGTEALSRFAQLPVRPPDAWFAEAATLGLGVELEMTALELALGQLNRLPPKMYLSLNASVETILSADFRATLAAAPAERIVLELTEHTPVTDYAAFERSMEEIRSHGVRLAVDDAGSGFSSFSHILNLKPDIIKLDIALTRGIDKDPARQALGRALLRFGLEMYRTTIVAEGIETKGELDTLRSLGCPSGQGFLLGRPSRLVNQRRKLPKLAPLPVPELATEHADGPRKSTVIDPRIAELLYSRAAIRSDDPRVQLERAQLIAQGYPAPAV